jgi:hypothetical protein
MYTAAPIAPLLKHIFLRSPSQVIMISTFIAKGEGFGYFGINTSDALIHLSNTCYIRPRPEAVCGSIDSLNSSECAHHIDRTLVHSIRLHMLEIISRCTLGTHLNICCPNVE